jgi:hypothetical protein
MVSRESELFNEQLLSAVNLLNAELPPEKRAELGKALLQLSHEVSLATAETKAPSEPIKYHVLPVSTLDEVEEEIMNIKGPIHDGQCDCEAQIAQKFADQHDSDVWQDDALCAQTDPSLFVAEVGGNYGPGKFICRQCPVKSQCLADAIQEEWGVSRAFRATLRGVKTPRERYELEQQYGADHTPFEIAQIVFPPDQEEPPDEYIEPMSA